jgi:5-methylcytosine-specific restriction endonuclease McrA
MAILDEFVLMLNKNWVPVETCTVRDAFCHLFAETGKFVRPDDFSVHSLESWLDLPVGPDEPAIRSARLSIKVPEIIVLKNGVAPPKKVMVFSKRNLLKRDRGTCQYCGHKPGQEELTMDHVLPRKRGGKSSWINCVLSCKPCNSKKADKMADEAGMSLRPRPELKLMFPTQPTKWAQPYEPAWSPVFKVSGQRFKESWTHFVGEK